MLSLRCVTSEATLVDLDAVSLLADHYAHTVETRVKKTKQNKTHDGLLMLIPVQDAADG